MGATVRMTRTGLAAVFGGEVGEPKPALMDFIKNLIKEGFITLTVTNQTKVIKAFKLSYDGLDLKIPFDGISKKDLGDGLLNLHEAVYQGLDSGSVVLKDDAISQVYQALLCIGAEKLGQDVHLNVQNAQGTNIKWNENFPNIERAVSVDEALNRGAEVLQELVRDNQQDAEVDVRGYRAQSFFNKLNAALKLAMTDPGENKTKLGGVKFQYSKSQGLPVEIEVNADVDKKVGVITISIREDYKPVLAPYVDSVRVSGGPMYMNESVLMAMTSTVDNFNAAIQSESVNTSEDKLRLLWEKMENLGATIPPQIKTKLDGIRGVPVMHDLFLKRANLMEAFDGLPHEKQVAGKDKYLNDIEQLKKRSEVLQQGLLDYYSYKITSIPDEILGSGPQVEGLQQDLNLGDENAPIILPQDDLLDYHAYEITSILDQIPGSGPQVEGSEEQNAQEKDNWIIRVYKWIHEELNKLWEKMIACLNPKNDSNFGNEDPFAQSPIL